MNGLTCFVAAHGPMLLAGISALLVAGTVATASQRSPIHRQRLGEMTIACTIAWLALACIPLPRWPASHTADQQAPDANVPAVVELSPQELEMLREITRPTSPAPRKTLAIAPNVESAARTTRRTKTAIDQATGSSLSDRGSVQSPIDAPQMPVGIWLARTYVGGVGVCLAWLVLGHVLLVRMIRAAAPPEPWLAELFASVAREFGVQHACLRVSSRPIRPLSCGLIRPTVLLGADVAICGNTGHLRQVLRHELAHLAQRDAWGNALFNLAFPLLYLHPLYWWLRSRTFLARELIADDRAAAATGRVTYAADLLSLAKACRAPGRGPLGAVAMFHFTTDLYRRILMLVQRQGVLQTRCSGSWRVGWIAASAAVFVLACGTLGLRSVAAQVATARDQEVTATETRTADAAAELGIDKADTATADRVAATSELADTGRKDGDVSQDGPSREALERKLKAAEDQVQQLRRLLGAVGMETRDPRNETDVELKRAYDELGKAAADRDTIVAGRLTKLDQDRDLKVGGKTTALVDGDKGLLATSDLVGAKSIRPGLDLVNLANSYADAVGNIQVARARVKTTTMEERAVAEAQVRNAEAKARLLGNIIKVALSQAQAELDRTRTLAGQGAISHSELQEAEGRAQILRLILQSGQEGGGPDQSKTQSGNEANNAQLGNDAGRP